MNSLCSFICEVFQNQEHYYIIAEIVHQLLVMTFFTLICGRLKEGILMFLKYLYYHV